MNILETSYNALKEVVGEDVSFSLALKHLFAQEKSTAKEKNEVSVIVGCVLRHYYIFSELVNRYFPELDTASKCALYIMMAKVRFLNKGKDNSESIVFAKDKLAENKATYDSEQLDNLIDYLEVNEVLIPSDIDITSIDYIHYRYNLPIPVVKMWLKGLGRNTAYKVFKVFTKSINRVYRVNTLKISLEDFKKTYSDTFITSDKYPYIVFPNLSSETYKRDSNIALNKCHIYATNLGLEEILSKLEIKETDNVAALSSSLTPLYLDLANKCKDNLNKIDVIFETGADYYKATKSLHAYGIDNLRFYTAAPSSFITCISEPVDYFFLSPKNSNFELFRLSPDYAIHFNSETLDGLIENEKNSVEEASKLLKDGGKIVYIVPTISHKEGKSLIHDFILHHPEFSLVEEDQYLPIDEERACSMYYAIIAKEVPSK